MGCTVAPVAQFNAYRIAFDQARAVGEAVLLNYAVAKESVLPREEATSTFEREARLPNRPAPGGVDEVQEFMAGWEAVGRYNEFVTAIVNGREESEVQAIYGGFQAISSSLPKRTAEAVAGAAGPWSAVIDLAIGALDQELSNRRFVRKLKEGGDIVQAILRLHAGNAERFYDVLYLANESQFVPVSNRFRRALNAIRTLLEGHAFEAEEQVIQGINERVARFPSRIKPIDPESALSDKPAAAEADRVNLANHRADLEARLVRAIELTARLAAQKEVLLLYRDLIDVTEAKLLEAVRAAATGRPGLPDPEPVRRLVVEVRKALVRLDHRR